MFDKHICSQQHVSDLLQFVYKTIIKHILPNIVYTIYYIHLNINNKKF